MFKKMSFELALERIQAPLTYLLEVLQTLVAV